MKYVDEFRDRGHAETLAGAIKTYRHEALDDHGGVRRTDPFNCAVWARRVVAWIS